MVNDERLEEIAYSCMGIMGIIGTHLNGNRDCGVPTGMKTNAEGLPWGADNVTDIYVGIVEFNVPLDTV